ncbi:MAG TPA: hypothetical protein DD708_08800 [Deltaproteobacteria bacterium]|nr:hypothetical protein [Deltaproteobacteria bacterium]
MPLRRHSSHHQMALTLYKILFFLYFLGTMGLSFSLQAKVPPKNKEPMNYDTCTSKGCHSNLKQKKYTHNPIEANGCNLCHNPIMGKHKFEFTSPPQEMCIVCHDSLDKSKFKKVGNSMVIEEESQSFSTHRISLKDFPPHIKRKILSWGLTLYDQDLTCLTCHNPHSSDKPRLIRPLKNQEDFEKPLCVTCHEEKTKTQNHPLKEDTCFQCHNFHQGMIQTPLLRIAKNRRDPICLQCHKEKTSIFNTKHDYFLWTDERKKEVSGFFDYPTPTTIRCELCHTIHHTKAQGSFLLTSKVSQEPHKVIALCTSCHHNEKAKSIPQIKYIFKHVPILFSSIPDPKTRKEITLKFFSTTGKRMRGTEEPFEFSCATCHNPHAWGKDYMRSFFLTNSTETMKFCSSCHGKEAKTLYSTFHDHKPKEPHE